MTMISDLILPGSKDRIPIFQMTAVSCIKWLNPRRENNGLPVYPIENVPERPPIEELRNEIIELVIKKKQNGQQEVQGAGSSEADLNDGSKLSNMDWKQVHNLRCVKLVPPLTNLWIASYYGRLNEVKQYLQLSDAAINAPHPAYPKQSPLHCAAAGNQIDLVRYFLKNNVDVSAQDSNGNTPLHIAARWGHEGVVKLLLQAKSSSICLNRKNKSAVDIAREHLHEKTMAALDIVVHE